MAWYKTGSADCTGTPMPPNFSQVATDRLPTALVIETASLPLPFN